MGDLLGPCLFAVLMGIGRTIYGVWGSRINLENALIACGLLCVLCYLVTAFVQIPVISLIGCAVCGFSVSLMWPGTFSLLAKHYPKGGTAMFGILAVMGDMGAAIGPWMAGLVSDAAQKSSQLIEYGQKLGLHPDQIGLKTGILLGTVFPLLLFIGVLALKRFYVKQSLGTEKEAA